MLIILLIILLQLPSSLISQEGTNSVRNTRYSPYDSDTRFILNLKGSWEMSLDESDWSQSYIPYSNKTPDRIIYKRTIKIDEKIINKYRWQIYCEGINDQAEIYINEQFVGRYFGGLTPFEVRIPTRIMMKGANTIKLIVTPSTHSVRQVKQQNIFFRKDYTGVIRDLYLVGTTPVWISSIRHRTRYLSGNNFQLKASVNISSGSLKDLQQKAYGDTINVPGATRTVVTITAALISQKSHSIIAQSPPRNVVIERERTITEYLDLNIFNPELWSPSEPSLYKLEIKLTKNGTDIDVLSSNVGFRNITIARNEKSPQFIVNGQLLKLKGVSYIEDYKKRGQSLTHSQMEKDIELIKMLGANAIRVKYYPASPYFIELCERYGIFVMLELPLYETPANMLSLDEIKVRMSNFAKSLLSVYDNSPSIFGYGISDGIVEGEESALHFSKLITDIIRKNSGNLIYKTVFLGSETLSTDGYNFINVRKNRIRYNFDIFKNQIGNIQYLAGSLPIVVSYGIPTLPTNHGGYSDPLSLESQAYYIRNSFYTVTEADCGGSIINTYNDYLLNSPQMIIPNDNPYLLTSGLVDRRRSMRLSFETLQALFNNEKEPLLNAGSYTEQTPVAFIIVGLGLALIFVFLINRFRRFREYIFRSLLRPYNFYADIRDQRIISSKQTFLLGFIISFTLGLLLASLFYFYRSNIFAQYLYIIFIPLDSLQEFFFKLIWMPELLLVILSLASFAVLFLSSLVLRLFAILVRSRIFISDTFTIVIWSSIPVLLLLPMGIILIRMLVFMPGTSWLVLVVLALVLLWVILRILKATSVVFDIPSVRAYIVGAVFIFIAAGVVLSIYQYQYSLISYMQYFFDVLLKS